MADIDNPTQSAPQGPWEKLDWIHRTNLKGIEKAYLVAVARMESRRRGTCIASINTLADQTGFSQRALRNAAERLRNGIGVLEVENRTGRTSSVKINWPAVARLVDTPAPDTAVAGAEVAVNLSTTCRTPRHHVPTRVL